MASTERSTQDIVDAMERRSKRSLAALIVGMLLMAVLTIASTLYLNGLRRDAEERAEVAERKANSLADTLELARQAYEAGNRPELEKHLRAAIAKSEQLAQTAALDPDDRPPAAPVPAATVSRSETAKSRPGQDAAPRPSDRRRPPAAAAGQERQATMPQLVFIQFAGRIAREDVAEFNQMLRAEGWRAQGPSGERTAKAIGFNEVRYSSAEDREAAEVLAATASNSGYFRSPVKPKKVGIIKPGTLELWVSN